VPAKVAIVFVPCARCGARVPLSSVASSATCAACAWTQALGDAAWQWVLEPGARAASTGAIQGETRASALGCAACKATLPESVVARAFAQGKNAVACPQCSAPTTMRRVSRDCVEIAAAPPHPEARVDVPCSNCGARLAADGSTQTPVCTFCGTTNALPLDVWARLHPAGLAAPFFVWSLASRPKTPASVYLAVAGALVVVAGLAALVAYVVRASRPPSPIGAVGGACSGTQAACTADGESLLECENEKFAVACTCKGSKGCRPTEHGRSVSCDYTRADENDPCNVKDFACSTDGKSELRCDGSKFVLASPCGGADGCTLAPDKDGFTLSCDDHVSPVGAPCLADGRFACSPDGKSMLRCSRGHFELASTCKGPKACAVAKNAIDDTTAVSCDGNVADVGDPCRPDAHACDSGGKQLLACDGGRFARWKPCPGGCAPRGEQLECRGAR